MTAPPGLFARHPNAVFVETGTYRGDGVAAALAAGFERVHSIELSPALHATARKRFAGDSRVTLHLGDSGDRLPELLAEIAGPITFWLDGHYSAGETARGRDSTPLQRELAAIAAHPQNDHTLLIDDVRCFGTDAFDHLSLDETLAAVRRVNPAYTVTYADGHTEGDVLVATPPGSRRDRGPLKILHAVEFYHPHVGGAQAVVREVSERLAAKGHRVTVATTALRGRTSYRHRGVDIAGFDVSGSLTQGLRGDIDGYQRFLLDGDFDVMMAYAAQQWTVDAAWTVFDRLPYPTVLATCGFSGLHVPRFKPYFAALPGRLRRLDRLLFHSDTYQDRVFCDAHNLQHRSVTVPNAASAADFPPPADHDPADHAAFRQRHCIPPTGPLLLTVGNHTGLKGHGCTLSAFAKLKTPDAHLLIIGGGSPQAGCTRACARAARRLNRRVGRRGTVRSLSLPRDAVRSAFAAADLFVFPSRVECSPLVLFEAMAAGLPFLSGPAGNSAEIAAWSGGGEIIDGRRHLGEVDVDPKELAPRIDALLAAPARLAELGARGRASFEERFTWDRAADRYEWVYRDAVLQHGAGG